MKGRRNPLLWVSLGVGAKTQAWAAASTPNSPPLGGVDLGLLDRGDRAADLVRRDRIAELFVSGDWGVELETFEADQERERQQEAET